jgi:hypothetical protein
MEIKDIEKLLKLCRKQGVTEFTSPDISFKLGDLPVTQSQRAEMDLQEQEEQQLSEKEMDDLVFYSVGGIPPGAN